MIEKFNVPALQQWRLRPSEINCLHPRGSQAGLPLGLQQGLPAPQSLAHACRASQAQSQPTALTRATPHILTPFLCPVCPPLPEQLFACAGLSGRGHIRTSLGPSPTLLGMTTQQDQAAAATWVSLTAVV